MGRSFASMSRVWLVSAGTAGLLALLAAFAGGVLAANATMDDGESPPASGVAPQVIPGKPEVPMVQVARDGGGAASVPSTGVPADAIGGMSDAYYNGCAAPLEGVLGGGKVDPAFGGFPARWLGEGFQFAGLTIRSERDCGSEGSAVRTVLETTWIHTATGQSVHVAQAPDQGGRPNMILIGNADFARDGYRFNVSGGFASIAVDTDVVVTPVKESVAPASGQSQAAIEEAVKQLAGDLDQRCFYRQRQGTWEDVVAQGIGDPRGLIPAALKEIQLQITLFDRPAADCQAPALVGFDGLSLHAIYGDRGGMLSISVSRRMAPSAPTSGRFGSGSADWSNGQYQFSVNWQPGSLTDETARAIAERLDPSFGKVCLVEVRPMSESEAKERGIVAPTAPEGYRLESREGSAVLIAGNANCGAAGENEGYRAEWMLTGESVATAGVIVVESFKGPQEPNRPTVQFYEPARSLFWVDARGVSHAVSGIKAEAPRETLLAVARSVDPGFDESRLTTPRDITPPGGAVPEKR